jgi:dehydrogenase/reductase SDR family protein 12
MGFGQFAATSQFYLYGRKHFTKTGWEKHRARYQQPDLLEQDLDLSGKVYMITGANSGVGKEVAQFLASKRATIYMVCRSKQRAEAARDEIQAAASQGKVRVIQADVGLEADVRRCWQEFLEQEGSSGLPRLDGLVCNAGALLNTKTLTSEGVEVTFASHLLFGTYLLGKLAMPALEVTEGSRFVAVSSGGMYNFPFPSWEVATSTSTDPKSKYDGQFAYGYAKRGQVLLCERWAEQHSKVKVVSCHPGWSSTPAVEEAYGDTKKYLEPMRTPWEGAEGIAWLMVAPSSQIQGGAFYLDREPQSKHLAGPFFTEGSFTKNTPEEVEGMMRRLEEWSSGHRPADLASQAELQAKGEQARENPLTAMERAIDIQRFMGKWYVIFNIPTLFDKGTVNNVENYTYDEAKRRVDIDFTYCNKEMTKSSLLKQRAAVKSDSNTQWALSPKVGVYLPTSIPYLIVDCAEDYSTCVIGVPDRSFVWVMARTPTLEPEVAKALTGKVVELGYDVGKLVAVPQNWDGQPPPLVPECAAGGA